MSGDVDRFLARFRRFGAAPSVESYLALFHPDATLFDSGMPRPLTVPEIPEHIEGILKLVPDFRMTPSRSAPSAPPCPLASLATADTPPGSSERWRYRAPTIFVEAMNTATLAGGPIEWASIYCIDLAGDRVIRGRRYYDRRPLFARLSPEIAGGTPFEPDPPPLGGPMPAAPPVFDALRRRIPDLALRLLARAGDGALVMSEWEASGTLADQAICFGIADRFDLRDGQVVAAHSYFDTLVLGP